MTIGILIVTILWAIWFAYFLAILIEYGWIFNEDNMLDMGFVKYMFAAMFLGINAAVILIMFISFIVMNWSVTI